MVYKIIFLKLHRFEFRRFWSLQIKDVTEIWPLFWQWQFALPTHFLFFWTADCTGDSNATSLTFLLNICKNPVGILLETGLWIRAMVPVASGITPALCCLLLVVRTLHWKRTFQPGVPVALDEHSTVQFWHCKHWNRGQQLCNYHSVCIERTNYLILKQGLPLRLQMRILNRGHPVFSRWLVMYAIWNIFHSLTFGKLYR